MLRWIVGSQMLLVQIASNVPTQNKQPDQRAEAVLPVEQLHRHEAHELPVFVAVRAAPSASACRRSRTAAKRSGSTMPRRMNTSSSAGTMPT